MPDDGGVLGNLPRSRPGQRSEKRAGPKEGAEAPAAGAATPRADGPAKASAKAASRDERSGSKAAPTPRQSRPRSAARAKPAAGGDPVAGAIRGVAGIAVTGARLAGGVARELLRRVPRP